MANDNGISQEEAAGVNRRNLLKGAVAAGVGVVAWSSPSITSIGMTPAYAAACTGQKVSWFIGSRNTSCDCEVVVGGETVATYVQYKQLQSDCGPLEMLPPTNAGVPTRWDPPNSGRYIEMNWPDSGNCPPEDADGQTVTKKGTGEDGSATVYISPLDTSEGELSFCSIRVEVTRGQCDNIVDVKYGVTDWVGEGGGTVKMPAVECQGGGNIFTNVYLQCSEDESCLTL